MTLVLERIVVPVPVTAVRAQRRRHRGHLAVMDTVKAARIARIVPPTVAVVTVMGTELAVMIIALVSPIQDRPTQMATVTEMPVSVTLQIAMTTSHATQTAVA